MTIYTDQNLSEDKSNTDILIPFFMDNEDRLHNLNFVVDFLQNFGFSNIYVREYYDARSPEYGIISKIGKGFTHTPLEEDNFNKMRCVNEMVGMSNSKYLAVYDVDVIFSKRSLVQTLQMLREGADVVYPYDGRFYNVPKSFLKNLKGGQINLDDCELCNPMSYGGAVFFNRESFTRGGKCNPNFKNVGFDDNELYIRFQRLGFSIKRANGPLLHLDHIRSETSVEKSQYLNHNMSIYNHIASCPLEQLKQEITTW